MIQGENNHTEHGAQNAMHNSDHTALQNVSRLQHSTRNHDHPLAMALLKKNTQQTRHGNCHYHPGGDREFLRVKPAGQKQGAADPSIGLVSDPFFMDVEAALRTDMSGKLSFNTAVNTVHFRDVLSIAVEIPFAPIVERFDGVTLIGTIAEDVVTRRGKPMRIERLGRPEMKTFVLANPTRDARTMGIELRDLYNIEDAFELSREYRSLYESRVDANLAFFDGLDGKTAWPIGPDGRHPLRELFIGDFLIVDVARKFAPGNFLEIERSLMEHRAHENACGRWLDDDISRRDALAVCEWRGRRTVRRWC
jgi:hypothetical protein